MKKVIAIVLAVAIIAAGAVLCVRKFSKPGSDLVILYTNDVHCGVDDNIGYAGLAAYKKEVEASCPNVALVDCGDFVQGGLIGSVSSGEYIVNIMNKVGYDIAIPGNHEFDYGMDQLRKLVGMSEFDWLCCDMTYSGTGESVVDDFADYKIVELGDAKVSFIGVSTPNSITSSNPAYFKDAEGNFVYGFTQELYSQVEKCVRKSRNHGADYVVVLSHLGDTEDYAPYSSVELIQNTFGIDAVLDGHAHHAIESQTVKNSRGKDVILSSTGTKLESFGELKIGADGTITASLISDYTGKDSDTAAYIDEMKADYEQALSAVVGKADFTLSISDENGVRMVRSCETAIGDLCADAYRDYLGADIALCNGGGVRTDIKEGDITKGDIINVHPFSNTMCTIEATGAQIADALEWTAQSTKADYTDESGENGGFLQVSGLKYTIDTSIPSTVYADENGAFVGVDGERRVKDIMVLEEGEWVPIDPEKKYVVAGSEYVLINGGDGMTAFHNSAVVSAEGVLDNEVLMNYIVNTMGGKIDEKYRTTDGRITVK